MCLTLSRGITTSILSLASCIRSRGFKLAITSEIIGKLGGRVEEATVEGREITASNVVIHTVEVPPGKQVLVSFIGRFSKTSSNTSSWPVLRLGTSEVTTGSASRDVAISAILTESGNLTITAGSGALSATLTGGTVYTAEM